jgi:transposase-like protein
VSDPLEEVYRKYFAPRWEDVDLKVECPKCKSMDVDHTRGYRGEYTCKNCGNFWRT